MAAELQAKVAKVKAALEDVTPEGKEAGLKAFAESASSGVPAVEPYLIELLPVILERLADKSVPVKKAAEAAGLALMKSLSNFAVPVVLPTLFGGMDQQGKWETKAGSLKLLGGMANAAPEQTAACLPDIVPAVMNSLSDAKPQVKKEAMASMNKVCKASGNRDIELFIPALISSLGNPAEVPTVVHQLSATTFVQQVEAPALAIMVPLLLRGLRKPSLTPVRRKAAVIIDNMAKLVDNPVDALVFLPQLLPDLKKAADEIANPEARSVCSKAVATLELMEKEAKEILGEEVKKTDKDVVLAALKEIIAANSSTKVDGFVAVVVSHVAAMTSRMISAKNFKPEDWAVAVDSYLVTLIGEASTAAVGKAFLKRCYDDDRKNDKVEEEDEDAALPDLCNCEFSLAYGGKILLNGARLRLKRGKIYGLCGPNGCGKSTLMRSIAEDKLEGFPSKDELRTVYVEHDIDSEEADTPVADFILQSKGLVGSVTREEVVAQLSAVGFTDVMQSQAVGSLSGGWKMKLALARAMLMKADILLLDEPTNHLDVTNVKWLENYITGLKTVTSMIVSHDSSFLDNVCTHIIHYEQNRKLKQYRGNMADFVKVRPEAMAYYELGAAVQKFVLPAPGFLEGIKSKDRAILKMQHVDFAYPGTDKNVLNKVSIHCSLNSRVAIHGPNGAGKSTMIKLLTGELEPVNGLVWKHPNLRIAYVAQHAFHHIEQHTMKTPNEYIQWRYATGEDREEAEKVTRQVTEEETAKMAEKHVIEGEKRVVEKLLARRKLKKSYEYEVQWVGLHSDKNSWLTRDALEEMGFAKLVNAVDAKEAERMGLYVKPLTQKNIEKHLEDLGIEPEFGTHNHIRGLSGGQKVKVVIAAAMWNNPHMLVLDEPTNYLDRDSLGALAGAIKEFEGGVIMITHAYEFSDALCSETWTVDAGSLRAKGGAALTKEKIEYKPMEEMTDALGNTIKLKTKKTTMSNKEKKKYEKLKKARKERGEEVSEDEEDWPV